LDSENDDVLLAVIEHCSVALSLHEGDGSFIFASPACTKLYGGQVEALPPLSDTIAPSDREPFLDAWNRVFVRGESVECRCRTRGGQLIEFKLSPATVSGHSQRRIMCASQEIIVAEQEATTPQGPAHDALAPAHDALARAHRDALIDLLPGLVWYGPVTADLSSYKLSFMSDYLFEVTGYSADEWFNTPGFWRDRIHPADRTQALEHTAQMLRGEIEQGLPYRFRTANGRYLWLRTSLQIERDAEGYPQRMFGVTLDVTELIESRQQAEVLEGEVEAKSQELLELSAPLIRVDDGILVLPLIGTITPHRARHALRSLLLGIKRYKTSSVIIDLTGLALADRSSVAALTQAIAAVELLGATAVITGVGSRIALLLLEAGLLNSGVMAYPTVAEAISSLKRAPRRRATTRASTA